MQCWCAPMQSEPSSLPTSCNFLKMCKGTDLAGASRIWSCCTWWGSLHIILQWKHMRIHWTGKFLLWQEEAELVEPLHVIWHQRFVDFFWTASYFCFEHYIGLLVSHSKALFYLQSHSFYQLAEWIHPESSFLSKFFELIMGNFQILKISVLYSTQMCWKPTSTGDSSYSLKPLSERMAPEDACGPRQIRQCLQ